MSALDMPVARVRLNVIRIEARAIAWDMHRDSAPGQICPYCWRVMLGKLSGLRAPTWDHVVPISRGGPDSRDNMIVVCRGCNQDKADRNPVEWLGILRYLGDQRAPKVERFLEIIGAGWTDEDRATMNKIVDEWEARAATALIGVAASVRAAIIDLQTHYSVALSGEDLIRDRICAAMEAHGIDRRMWSYTPPCIVRVTTGGRVMQLTYTDEAAFRRVLAVALGKQPIHMMEAAE